MMSSRIGAAPISAAMGLHFLELRPAQRLSELGAGRLPSRFMPGSLLGGGHLHPMKSNSSVYFYIRFQPHASTLWCRALLCAAGPPIAERHDFGRLGQRRARQFISM